MPFDSRKPLCILAGGVTATLGLVVMAGWLAHSEMLVRTPAGFAPMYFNVALCFFLLGLGLIASVWQQRRLSLTAASLSGLIAALTLFQSIFSVDLKIDRLFVEPFIAVPGARFPGRMQRDGAFTFLLASFALVLFNLRRRRSVLGIVLSSWPLVIGTVALLAYALVYVVYDTQRAQLSVHYAAAFVVLGTGLVLRGLQFEARERQNQGLRLRILLGYAAALVLLLSVALGSQLALARSSETERIVIRTLQVRAQIEELFSQLKDVQRGQRGFALTGNETYLEPYNSGRNSIRTRLATLRGLIADSGQQQRLSALAPLIQGQLQVNEELVKIRREKGAAAAVARMREGQGEHGLRDIRQRIVEMQQFQDGLLRQRTELSQRTSLLTGRINSAGILLTIVVVVTGLIIVFRGLRARERAEDAIQDLNSTLHERSASLAMLNDQLTEVNRELEAFSYSVSHDLRAPLRHMTGFAQILKEDYSGSLPEEAQTYLARIQRSANRMGMLIDGLLNLSRLGRAELASDEVDLNRLAHEVQEMISADLGTRPVEWRVGQLPVVQCDSRLVRQVLMNLLSNALKYSRNNAVTRIEIGQVQTNGSRPIFVKDNGVGFDMQYAEKLFGVFQRLHKESEFEGTGIGLATVRRIVGRHGGKIWAESTPGQGATFYFTLSPEGPALAAHQEKSND